MRLKPLGIFGGLSGEAGFGERASLIRELIGELDEDAEAVAAYLRQGIFALAYMGVSQDLVGKRFMSTGGCAIQTDGEFYWRGDTADYVETYRVGLPSEFIEHGRSRNWAVPAFSPEERVLLEGRLAGIFER